MYLNYANVCMYVRTYVTHNFLWVYKLLTINTKNL